MILWASVSAALIAATIAAGGWALARWRRRRALEREWTAGALEREWLAGVHPDVRPRRMPRGTMHGAGVVLYFARSRRARIAAGAYEPGDKEQWQGR